MTTTDTIAPHGGTLVNLLAEGAETETLAQEAANLPKIVVNPRELSDLEMLTVGALSPLTGFQGEGDYHSILETMHLENGLAWAIPVTLSLDEEEVKRIGGAEAVALLAEEGGEREGGQGPDPHGAGPDGVCVRPGSSPFVFTSALFWQRGI